MIAVGAVVLIAHTIPAISGLVTLIPGRPGMSPITAALLIACGSALCLLPMPSVAAPWRLRAVRLLAGLVTGTAIVSLLDVPRVFETTIVATGTATGFLLAGTALLLIRRGIPMCERGAHLLALVLGAIGLLGVSGHALGGTLEVDIPFYRGMAIHTAAALGLLCLGVLPAISMTGLAAYVTNPQPSGAFLRRMLVPAGLLPVMIAVFDKVIVETGLLHLGTAHAVSATILAGALCCATLVLGRRFHLENRQRRAAEAHMRAVFNSGSHFLTLLDPDGGVVELNQRSLSMFPLKREELVGRNLLGLIAPFASSESIAGVARGVELARAGVESRATLGSGGKAGYLELIIRPLLGADSRVEQILVEGIDLTELKTALDEARRSRDELAVANRALETASHQKDAFLAGMSHELRTPLNAILMLSEALGEKVCGELNDRQERMVNQVFESGHHLLDLVNDLLDVAKGEAGKIELELQHCDLEAVCESALRLTRPNATARNQQLEFTIAPPGIRMIADDRRLKQMLVNLLGNAIKFSPTGKRIGLDVAGDEARSEVRLTVWDEGPGIAAELIPRLFQPFVQLDTSLRREAGSGLGLSLVKRMAELHGGSVALESKVGEGSRFTLSLPWNSPNGHVRAGGASVPGASEPAAATAAERAPSRTRSPEDPPLIIVAEDNAIAAEAIQAMLTAAGYETRVAVDGIQLVAVATAEPPDLILLDVQMPNLDGLEAMRRMRGIATLANVPMIALTAMAMPGDRQRCLEAGANHYISKPIRLASLRDAVREWLGR
ncbi:MAG: ATP-binding protein [Planctomycetota bacterium]